MSPITGGHAARAVAVRQRPLVLHVVFSFDTGGLENGLVNLINHMPADAYRHAIVALTYVSHFRHRVQRGDVEFIELHKTPGHGVKLYPRLWKLFRQMGPAVVHTRNLAALETVVPAWAAGVPVRIHGEHGRDVGDLDGSSVRYQRVRRLYQPFVNHYVALSRDLSDYLVEKVHVPADRVSRICNGVDVQRFAPGRGAAAQPIAGCPFDPSRHWIVGTVGRMQSVKDQLTLARAFVLMLQLQPQLREHARLVMVGEGPLRAQAGALLQDAGVADLAWLPGERADVPDVMRGLHCFALPSLAEGISNTILEALASGLPVVSTAVGGSPELLNEGTGVLVPSADPQAMAQALLRLALDPALAQRMGRAARADAEARFSLQAMVASYQRLYDTHLNRGIAAG